MYDVLDAEQPTEFFAPVATDLFSSLVAEYDAARAKIIEIGELATGTGFNNAIWYFIEGNAGNEKLHRGLYVDKLFRVDGAIAALNSAYWQKALAMTDVLELMPQARRDKWHEEIREKTTPDFTEDTVRATILSLMNSRAVFFAERIDGIFRGLSGEHVTNAPEAFGKRMILKGVRDSRGLWDSSKSGLIHDLRCVLARFMGEKEPFHRTTDLLLAECDLQSGQWVTCDGGAIKVRTYKNGNGHMEVHPDMAWRLNMMLAHIYPTAIPAEFRQKPKKARKEFEAMLRPLPAGVLELLFGCVERRKHARDDDRQVTLYPANRNDTGVARDEAARVLEAIGGIQSAERNWIYDFDYKPDDVLREIVISGCLPDRVAFQFYPTPEHVAQELVALADIEDNDTILEPSAGQGALAALLPADQLECVELSALHCAVLKARGFKATQADFLVWSEKAAEQGRMFTKIVMNPPFADGRAKLHVEQAFRLLAPGGRLAAIVPASMRGTQFLPGATIEWARTFNNEFKGTSASVSLMVVSRSAA